MSPAFIFCFLRIHFQHSEAEKNFFSSLVVKMIRKTMKIEKKLLNFLVFKPISDSNLKATKTTIVEIFRENEIHK